MLMIRLARIGKKKQPHYRLVISEKARDTYGKALEIVGNYNPRSKEINLKTDRIKHWLSLGAQASDTVYNILIENKVIEGKKKAVTTLSKKKRDKLAKKDEKKQEKEAKVAEKAEETAKVSAQASPSDEHGASGEADKEEKVDPPTASQSGGQEIEKMEEKPVEIKESPSAKATEDKEKKENNS